MAADRPQSPDPYLPKRPIPAKPIVKTYPTPSLVDRIFVERKDTRAGGYRLPDKGDAYDGVDVEKLEGFVFAKAVPADQTGWVDHFYLNERANQEDYNYVIDYPWADHNYPRYTRTYTLLREDVVEPDADSLDPIYKGGEDEFGNFTLELKLIEHKQIRFEDPVLDSLFVSVQRTYERLPGPIITSYDQSPVKQILTIEKQDVETDSAPVSSALTEVLKVDRNDTAKAVVTTATRDSIFPADSHEIEIQDLLPLEMRALVPTITEGVNVGGDAVLPTLGVGELKKSEVQKDEFEKRTEVTRRTDVLPKELHDHDLGGISSGGAGQFTGILDIKKRAAIGLQTIDQGFFITDAEVHDLGNGTSYKITKTIDQWLPIYELLTDEKEGIRVLIKKEVIAPLSNSFQPAPVNGAYVDIHPYDKWRSIQVTSRVDPTSLPGPLQYAATQNYVFPHVLEDIHAVWTGDTDYSAEHKSVIPGVRAEDSAIVSTSSAPVGAIVVTIRKGFAGASRVRIVRTFLPSAPGLGQIKIPQRIRTVSGHAYIYAAVATLKEGTGAGFEMKAFSSKNFFAQVEISDVLTGSLVISGDTHSESPFITVTADSTGYTNAGNPGPTEPHHVGIGISSSGKLVVDLPDSDPGVLTPNSEMLIAVNLERWRFGIYVMEEVFIRVPPAGFN